MKKIIVIASLFALCFSGTAFAEIPLDGLAGGLVSLSNGVTGDYDSDGANTTDDQAVNFVMSTGHNQGNTVYATSNFTTAIYKAGIASTVFESSDLLGSVTTFTSASVFGTDWKEM